MSSQRTYTEEEKMKYVAEFKASGMSMNEYAKEVDIPEATFRDWIKVDRELGFGRINVNKLLTPVTPVTTTNKKRKRSNKTRYWNGSKIKLRLSYIR